MKTKTLAVTFALSLIVTTTRGATNSWKVAFDDYWDTDADWSLNVAPSPSQSAILITNATSKTVLLDATDSSSFTNTMTISNLTIAASGTVTNTLFLDTPGTNVPLRILNGLSTSNGGLLRMRTAYLRVDGLSGGQFSIDGVVTVTNSLMITTNVVTAIGTSSNGVLTVNGGTWRAGAVSVRNGTLAFNGGSNTLSTLSTTNASILQFALGTNSTSVAVSSDLTLGGTLNVTNKGGFTNTTYTLFTYGGTLVNNGLTIGTTPNSNFTYAVSTATSGQVNLIVTSTNAPAVLFQITSIVRQGNDISITWNTSGVSNIVQVSSGAAGGSYSNNFIDLSGPIFISTPTTNFTDVGGATNAPTRFYRIRSP